MAVDILPEKHADTAAETGGLERTSCPLCGSRGKTKLHSFEPYGVVSCTDCGLVYLDPRLREDLMRSRYERADYFNEGTKGGYDDYRLQERSLRLTFRRFLKELSRRGLASGKLLEVGSGYGYFLDEAGHYFSDRTGVELSAGAAARARECSECDVHVGIGETVLPQLGTFDVIVAVNVIEHVYAPVEFAAMMRRHLNPGGTLVLATPDIGSVWYRLLGRRWPSFKIPEHVAFFNEGTLRRLFLKAGFGETEVLPYPHAFPLGVVAGKLRLAVTGALSQLTVWLPRTMVAVSSTLSHG